MLGTSEPDHSSTRASRRTIPSLSGRMLADAMRVCAANCGSGAVAVMVLLESADCSNTGRMTLPPARASAASSLSSSSWVEVALKSISIAIWRAPASRSLSITDACLERGHGHTDISCRLGASIATTTTSPVGSEVTSWNRADVSCRSMNISDPER